MQLHKNLIDCRYVAYLHHIRDEIFIFCIILVLNSLYRNLAVTLLVISYYILFVIAYKLQFIRSTNKL